MSINYLYYLSIIFTYFWMKKSYTLDPDKLKATKIFSTGGIVISAVVSFWLFIIAKYAQVEYIPLITSILRSLAAIYWTMLIYIHIWWDEDNQYLRFSRAKRWVAFFFLYAAAAFFMIKYTKLFNISIIFAIIWFGIKNDHRWFALFSMISLFQVIWYLLLDKQVAAETWAIYLYYGLVLTVFISFINDFLDSDFYKNTINKIRKIFGSKITKSNPSQD